MAVIGTGLMGSGIIHVYADHGYQIDIYGNSDRYKDKVVAYFDNEVYKGRMSEEKRELILKNLNYYFIASDLENIKNTNFVIETIKEDKELKQTLFKNMDTYLKDDAILVSNTSTFSITGLGSVLQRPENFAGMHFISPVPIIKVVEIVKGLRTSEATLNQVIQSCHEINKRDIMVDDHPGFVFNRIFLLWANEAVLVLMENLTKNPENIDEIMKRGMNLKVGPLKLIDLAGLDTVYYSLLSLYEHLHDIKYRPCPLLKKMLDAGYLGRKTGRGFYIYE
ncbi:3-hydroxyacyl-CoA dehydrogenase family protein [Anaerovirgula multivorans]|nr:3-hydroxyacyl-CoA dehydrogenase NAD-binding domain-containing protein [Anaerovirgula multivorans]